MTWQMGQTLADIEKETILQAFKFFQNNKTHTARSLGISIRTLDHKLDQYKGGGKDETACANAGMGVEPSHESAKEQPVPMREREKVQDVPPQSDAKGSAQRSNRKASGG